VSRATCPKRSTTRALSLASREQATRARTFGVGPIRIPQITVQLLREGQRIAHLSPAEGITLRAEVGYLRELKADHGLDRVVVGVDDAYLGRDQLRRVGDVATELRLPIDIHLLRDE
jgi:hypothetical protein